MLTPAVEQISRTVAPSYPRAANTGPAARKMRLRVSFERSLGLTPEWGLSGDWSELCGESATVTSKRRISCHVNSCLKQSFKLRNCQPHGSGKRSLCRLLGCQSDSGLTVHGDRDHPLALRALAVGMRGSARFHLSR